MYSITKTIEISGAHKLDLPYDSPCKSLHGHNWIIEIEVKSSILDSSGMIIDFGIIKKVVNQLDHKNITDILGKFLNPTAENIAKWICDKIQQKINQMWNEATDIKPPMVSKVTVQESKGNKASFIS